MTRRDGKLRLGVGLQGGGAHWREPGAPADGAVLIETYMEYARVAEEAKFDFGFIADSTYINRDSTESFLSRLEPLAALSAVSAVTRHLGLVGTFSTSYSYPFTTARQLATLDKISSGRAGWNAVTSAYEGVARNYNGDKLHDHNMRYEIADEYIQVCRGLWDSYESDAFVREKESGRYVDIEKMHTLDHQGQFFQVQGPMNMEQTPQVHPVIFQAGASNEGRNLAAKHADAIFSSLTEDDFETAKAYEQDLCARLESFGRTRNDILIFPPITPIVGATQAEADAKHAREATYVDIDAGLRFMQRYFDYFDFKQFGLDDVLPDLSGIGSHGWQSTTESLAKMARDEKLTLRQLIQRVSSPKGHFVGTPTAIADRMQKLFEMDAVDGFIVFATHAHFRDFVDQVVPILRQRGLFREEYEGKTFRQNLGLRTPVNRYELEPVAAV